MFKNAKLILAAALLFGSATAASSRLSDDAPEASSLRNDRAGLQISQFTSPAAQNRNSFDNRLESFGGY